MVKIEGLIKLECPRCSKEFYTLQGSTKKYCTPVCANRAKVSRYQAKMTGAIKECRECKKDFTQSQGNKWYCPKCQVNKKLVKRFYCWNCYACPGWKDIYLVPRSGQTCERCKRDYIGPDGRSSLAYCKIEAGYGASVPKENRLKVPGVRVDAKTEVIKK